MNTSIPATYSDPYPGLRGSERVEETCGKCAGSGIYTAPTSIKDGHGVPFCLPCQGRGSRSILVSSARERARRWARAAEDAAEYNRRFRERVAAFDAEYGERRASAIVAHEALRDGDPLKRDLGEALDLVVLDLNAGAFELIDEILAKIEKRAAGLLPAPSGRVLVEGEVLSIKRYEGDYGPSWKMLVQGQGWKAFGSVPSSILLDTERGSRVRFMAAMTPADDDPSFARYSRPTKAEVLS